MAESRAVSLRQARLSGPARCRGPQAPPPAAAPLRPPFLLCDTFPGDRLSAQRLGYHLWLHTDVCTVIHRIVIYNDLKAH